VTLSGLLSWFAAFMMH